MSAPRLPALFSLFRQRGPRGFDLVTRYYDPLKEERDERLRKARATAKTEVPDAGNRELFAQRMRHSWQRQSSDRTHLIRLALIMTVVLVIISFIVRSFGLLVL
jgi:hypothetical protein